MSKQDNYQEFTEVLLQSWNGLCLRTDKVVEEAEIKSWLKMALKNNLE